MKCSNLKKTTLLIIFFYIKASSISIVYNFRIAQITKQPIVINTDGIKDPYIVTGLIFNQSEKKYCNGIKENFTGGLGTFVYDFATSYYIRTDFAVANINEKIYNKHVFSETESDDILCTIGRNFIPTQKSRMTLSGLLGIPTHPVFALQHVAFGYGQIGTGVQLDGIYELNQHFKILGGTRYIYFVPRNAQDDNAQCYTFSIGNVADILIALQYNWATHHSLESGYAARWDFKASVYPHFDTVVAKTNYQRNSCYLVYKYKFKTPRVSHRFMLDIGYGSDSKPKLYGNQHIATIWGSWSVNF